MAATIAPAQAATYGSCASSAGYVFKSSQTFYSGTTALGRIKVYSNAGWYKCVVVDKILNNGNSTFVRAAGKRVQVDTSWKYDEGIYLYYAGPVYLGYARNTCLAVSGRTENVTWTYFVDTENTSAARTAQCEALY